MKQFETFSHGVQISSPDHGTTWNAKEVLNLVMQFSRSSHTCKTSPCEACLAPHLPKVVRAMEEYRPIQFVLPAFPGKSPNPAKVLGTLPDMAERHSLLFLQDLCDKIARIYEPGAKILLCSDGRVFSDVVGMREEDVTLYQMELARIIDELSLKSLSLFNLDDVFPGLGFDEMRSKLMETYGKSLEDLKRMVKLGANPEEPHEHTEAHRLYCGITRFLFEDALFPGQTKSRASIQKDARHRAYLVIQRSNAWSELISELFPGSVRLSIHSQICGAKKIGIRLLHEKNLMTPWHGVAVNFGGRIDFLKRSEAEALGHKHFLMLGQSHLEKLLDHKLSQLDAGVKRQTTVSDIELTSEGCLTTLSSGQTISSRFVIGADGSRSFVRNHFEIPFEVVRPQLIWAVVDGIVETDFPKVPEIINFQAETSDVAWIPREGEIDRFYIRMDTKDFTLEEVLAKINRAMAPHTLSFKEVIWFSQFSVKEGVTEKYSLQDRVFLAGDACHIHSVNGGQGLNTGLADAFNLIWKLNWVKNHQAPIALLQSYEAERRPVALDVVATSGELVRSTKYSESGSHAEDYVKIVQKRAGNITGMGIRYGENGLKGERLHDREIIHQGKRARLYSLLTYSKFTLFIFGETKKELLSNETTQIIQIQDQAHCCYSNFAVLVRPDSYIESVISLEEFNGKEQPR